MPLLATVGLSVCGHCSVISQGLNQVDMFDDFRKNQICSTVASQTWLELGQYPCGLVNSWTGYQGNLAFLLAVRVGRLPVGCYDSKVN